MSTVKRYDIAGHVVRVTVPEGDAILDQMEQYRPFEIADDGTGDVVCELHVVAAEAMDDDAVEVEMEQDDDGSQIIAGRQGGRPYFEFRLRGRLAARMTTSDDYRQAMVALDAEPLFGLNNALMVLYALATADRRTLVFHSSVVSCDGSGYMFLGKSGTGKSTHSRLWLRYIKGTELVNDDNPVVRQVDGQWRVFGSPWSGKTPCYRKVSYPIGGIVDLSQAPHNKIRRLRPLEAYAALVPSISGKRWDRRVADGLHEAEEALVGGVAMWHLECLPDEEAARVCHKSIRSVPETPEIPDVTDNPGRQVSDEEIIRSAVAMVKEGMRVTFPVRGYSMLPFIIGDRDSVDLVTADDPRVGDVVLAWVDGCRWVIHRIIALDGEEVTLMGDGNIGLMEHCQRKDIAARADAVVTPSGRRTSLSDDSHRRKARLWRSLLPVRRWILAIYRRTWLRVIRKQ